MGFETAGISDSGGSGGFHILGYTESQLERSSFDRHKSKTQPSPFKALSRDGPRRHFDPILTRKLVLMGAGQCDGKGGNQTRLEPILERSRFGQSGQRMSPRCTMTTTSPELNCASLVLAAGRKNHHGPWHLSVPVRRLNSGFNPSDRLMRHDADSYPKLRTDRLVCVHTVVR